MNDSVQLFDKKLSIVTRPKPKISQPKDILIKVLFSGVCGTDLHIIAGEFPSSPKALTLGHEFCGVVEVVGEEVTKVKVGDRVVVNPNNQCHVCEYCTNGKPHYCQTGGLNSTVGIWRNGGWSNYCRIPEVLAFIIPNEVPLDKAVFIEPYSCIARGWSQLADITAGDKILVCGAGIIGLFWASLLHFKGHRNIVVSELGDSRRTTAQKLGLDLKVVHPDHLVNEHREAVRNKDEKWGFDVIIDCTGAPKAIEQAFNWLRYGATLLVFGCCPSESEMKINPFQIFRKEIKIVGSLINPNTFPEAVALVRDMHEKYLSYAKLGIKTFDLQDYHLALDALSKGEASKAVFNLTSQ